jgi:hypothetical protein
MQNPVNATKREHIPTKRIEKAQLGFTLAVKMELTTTSVPATSHTSLSTYHTCVFTIKIPVRFFMINLLE